MKKWTRALLFIPFLLPAFGSTFGCGEPAPATEETRKANMSEADKADEAEMTRKMQAAQAKLDAIANIEGSSNNRRPPPPEGRKP
jgi:hypothetical protein